MATNGRRPPAAGRAYTINSVTHALRLLTALGDHPSVAVREGAELLDVAPSTAHRLLSTLQACGFAVQDPATRRYAAGPALLAVALASLQRLDVARVARPHLVALAAETRETASLAVAEGTSIRFLDSVEGPEVVRVTARTGQSLPAHLTAAGKVLLAGLGHEELVRLYPARRLPRRTARSLALRSALEAELDEVRQLGHATAFEESSPGLAAVAVGVRDVRGRVIAAITVSMPAERLDPRRVDRILTAAQRRARRVEQELGPAAT